jgi:protein-tyrosine phosphatase
LAVSVWFRTYGFSAVLDGLTIGAYPLDQSDVEVLQWLGIERVLNLVEDAEYRRGERKDVQEAFAAARIEERRLRLVDQGNISISHLEAAVNLIDAWLGQGHRIYLHCRAGWQRSAAVAAGVVALRTGIGIDDALAHVQARKPSADPLPHQRADLRRWWETRHPARDRRRSPQPPANAS